MADSADRRLPGDHPAIRNPEDISGYADGLFSRMVEGSSRKEFSQELRKLEEQAERVWGSAPRADEMPDFCFVWGQRLHGECEEMSFKCREGKGMETLAKVNDARAMVSETLGRFAKPSGWEEAEKEMGVRVLAYHQKMGTSPFDVAKSMALSIIEETRPRGSLDAKPGTAASEHFKEVWGRRIHDRLGVWEKAQPLGISKDMVLAGILDREFSSEKIRESFEDAESRRDGREEERRQLGLIARALGETQEGFEWVEAGVDGVLQKAAALLEQGEGGTEDLLREEFLETLERASVGGVLDPRVVQMDWGKEIHAEFKRLSETDSRWNEAKHVVLAAAPESVRTGFMEAERDRIREVLEGAQAEGYDNVDRWREEAEENEEDYDGRDVWSIWMERGAEDIARETKPEEKPGWEDLWALRMSDALSVWQEVAAELDLATSAMEGLCEQACSEPLYATGVGGRLEGLEKEKSLRRMYEESGLPVPEKLSDMVFGEAADVRGPAVPEGGGSRSRASGSSMER